MKNKCFFSPPCKIKRSVSFWLMGAAFLTAKGQEINHVRDTIPLEEVVVISSRFPERKAHVAQQTELVYAKQLQLLNAISTADVLQRTPGILVQKSQLGGGSPILRGFEASRVLLVIDGIRLNNAIYRAGHLQNAITVDHLALDRVEVGYGPSSVPFGSDALGGVIHFQTKKPQLNVKSLDAATGYSTAANEYMVNVTANYGSGKWASLTNITLLDVNDLRQGASGLKTDDWKSLFYVDRVDGQDRVNVNSTPLVQMQTDYKQIDILQKFLIKTSDRLSHVVNLQFSNSSNVPRYDRLAQLQGGVPRFAEWYYGPQTRFLGAYHLHFNKLSVFDQANITAAYQYVHESRHDRRLNNLFRNNRTEQVNIGSLNADFNKKWGKQDLSFGTEFNFNYVHSTAYAHNLNTNLDTPLDTRYPDGGSTVFMAGAFAAHRWEITPNWLLSDGLRLSYSNLYSKFIDQTFFPFPFNSVNQKNWALSGNLGLIYHSDNQWTASILGSTGFRAPNVDDLAKVFESVPGNVVVPNPNLKPEYTYNLEMTIGKKLASRTNLSVTSFYTWYRNAITTQPFLFNGQSVISYNGQPSNVTANVNAQKAYLYGFSGNISIGLARNWMLKSNATYTYARITSLSPEQPLDHIPPFFGMTGLRYDNQKYDVEFFVQYNAAKKIADYNVNGEDNLAQATTSGMPAWATLNLRTGCYINKALKLQLALENILDQNYRVFASGISAPGRNFILSLRGSF